MIRGFFLSIFVWSAFWSLFLMPDISHGATTFLPGSSIFMTGSNANVYFDVADDLYDAGSPKSAPYLDTTTLTFSGVIYLTGAGWVDLAGTGTDRVRLDCSAQPLSNLVSPCLLTGVAYSEIIGDIIFDSRVTFDPTTGLLSGRAATYIGDYDFSGVFLPLLPLSFAEGDEVAADHQSVLTLVGGENHVGPGAWQIFVQPDGGTNRLYLPGDVIDLSRAGSYRIEIRDPSSSRTIIDDFRVRSLGPSTTLHPDIASTLIHSYCLSYPLMCPDGSILSPTTLIQTSSSSPLLADGESTMTAVLKIRDRYGNRVTTGAVQVDYEDRVRDIQENGFSPFISMTPVIWPSLRTMGDLSNIQDGNPTTNFLATNLGDIQYSISSYAPTGSADIVSLSGVLYRDTLGVITDISIPSWKAPIAFSPWYTTTISTPMIKAGEYSDFTTDLDTVSPAPAPLDLSTIYEIAVGDNSKNSFRDFQSGESIACTKYFGAFGTDECDWLPDLYDPVIISTRASAFRGRYDQASIDISDPVSYRSYITYEVGGVTFLYPSTSANLGVTIPGFEKIKILGQHNIALLSGIGFSNLADFWNLLKKNTVLSSRNRTSYTDTDYIIHSGDITIDATSFVTGTPEKRTIITRGGDITITANILDPERPVAIIALVDEHGAGGKIMIDPSVTDIHASLFAERLVTSTGSHQLYIRGSLVSHNTKSDTICPYFVTPCTHPEEYNLENIRKGYLSTPGSPASSPRAIEYPDIPLIIEYDGGILTDTPPLLTK